jgi:methyl-accepting chemotaxis protein
MKFANLKIGVRLAAGFAIIFLFLIIVAFSGWSSLSRTKQNTDIIVHERNVKTKLATDMRQDVNILARSIRNYIIYSEKDMLALQAKRIADANNNFDQAVEKTMPLLRSAETRKYMEDIKAQRDIVRPMYVSVMSMIDAGKLDEAKAYLKDTMQAPQDKWFEQIAAYVSVLEKQNEDAIEQMNHDYSTAVTVLAGALVAALVLGTWIAWAVTRSITVPINEAVKIAETVASGDLTSRIATDRTDETGQLLQALARMNESLVRIVNDVRTGTDTIATASSQIASGNMDLSSRTEQQASSLEETASSMEELTSTVKQNADNARQANTLAQSASDVASKGGSVVSEVVATMESINESAKKIVDIISVIDGIAFQTNILALNAAVEAARAGEQGRGFAVVASEVRNLAQRSAGAAKEIKALIGDSVEKVDSGSKLVDQAGATMYEIVESVKRVTDIIGEITAASDEQTSGIEQINLAITQMDEVTQQNASLVEEAAAAAQALQDQAGGLAQLVSVFKIGAAQTAHTIARATAHAAKARPAAPKAVPSGSHPRLAASAGKTLRPVVKAPPRQQKEPAFARAATAEGDWEEF